MHTTTAGTAGTPLTETIRPRYLGAFTYEDGLAVAEVYAMGGRFHVVAPYRNAHRALLPWDRPARGIWVGTAASCATPLPWKTILRRLASEIARLEDQDSRGRRIDGDDLAALRSLRAGLIEWRRKTGTVTR